MWKLIFDLAAWSRGTYNFMLPLLFKHYLTPITLENIPAIREDDSSAASLGAFRAFSAKRDAAYSKKHNGAKKRRNLGLELAMFFAPELGWQIVRLVLFFPLSFLFGCTLNLKIALGVSLHLLPIPPSKRSSITPAIRQTTRD